MALVAQPTKISLDKTKKPTGFVDPGGVNLSGSQPIYSNLVLTVTKSVVDVPVKATTFLNIRTDAAIGIEKQVADKLALEMDDTANTITYNIDWKNVENNQGITDQFYTDVAAVYKCLVDVYIVIT